MASVNERKPFLLRLEPATMAALKAWAAEDLRSLNGQIEYLLRGALRDAHRLPSKARRDRADADAEPDGSMPQGMRHQQYLRSPAVRESAAADEVTS
jgi:hypothetical protein